MKTRMDRSEVVRSALHSAAKVAFSAALVGCGGVVIEDRAELGAAGAGGGGAAATDVGSTSNAGSTSTTTGSSTASSGAGGALACDAAASPPYSDATIVCCNALVENTFPSSAPNPNPPVTVTPDLVTCCDVALEARDHAAVNGPKPVPWQSGYACCSIPGVETPKPFSATCSPWGPPSPPSMPADLVWLEEAA